MKSKKLFIILVVSGVIFYLFPNLTHAEKIKLRVTVEKANVRLKPDLGSMVISEVPLGAVLEVEEQIGEWFKVSLPPDEKGFIVTGYIHSSVVEILEEKPVSPPPPKPPQLVYQPSTAPGISFGLRLFGGLNYLSPADVNEGVKGWSDYYDALATLYGYTVEGEAKPIHLGLDFGGDIIINFTPQIGIGLGIGYIQASKTSEVTFTNGTEGTWTNKPKIKALPIRAGIYYTFPMSDMMNFVINAGGELYMAKVYYKWHLEEDGYWEEINAEASSTGFGFHGGLGFEFALSSNMAFFIEGQARYAKIGGFEGTGEWENSGGISDKEEGKLYYFKFDTGFGKYYVITVSKDKPSGANISEVREAKVDFGGLNFIAGVRIRF
jgi:opacity protein-like surface antigen